MASVTPTARPGAAAKTILTAAASTCWPSMIVPMKNRSSVITAPGTPGSRWLNGRWALKMWVVIVAPASAAAQTCSAEASECPTDTMIPSLTSRRIASRAWSRSGARVTVSSISFVAGCPSSTSRAASVGSSMHSARCAPLRASEMNGPSRCTPRIRQVGRPSAASRAAFARLNASLSSSRGAVMMVGSKPVTPRAASPASTSSHCSGVASAKSAPKDPLFCRSISPGVSTPDPRSMSRGSVVGDGCDPITVDRQRAGSDQAAVLEHLGASDRGHGPSTPLLSADPSTDRTAGRRADSARRGPIHRALACEQLPC